MHDQFGCASVVQKHRRGPRIPIAVFEDTSAEEEGIIPTPTMAVTSGHKCRTGRLWSPCRSGCIRDSHDQSQHARMPAPSQDADEGCNAQRLDVRTRSGGTVSQGCSVSRPRGEVTTGRVSHNQRAAGAGSGLEVAHCIDSRCDVFGGSGSTASRLAVAAVIAVPHREALRHQVLCAGGYLPAVEHGHIPTAVYHHPHRERAVSVPRYSPTDRWCRRRRRSPAGCLPWCWTHHRPHCPTTRRCRARCCRRRVRALPRENPGSPYGGVTTCHFVQQPSRTSSRRNGKRGQFDHGHAKLRLSARGLDPIGINLDCQV